jgi:hypothetical protein
MVKDTPENRVVIANLFAFFQAQHSRIAKERNKLTGPTIGFGAYDDDEYAKAQEQHTRSYALLDGESRGLSESWTHILSLFGEYAVWHAIDESQKRIGQLPYVE